MGVAGPVFVLLVCGSFFPSPVLVLLVMVSVTSLFLLCHSNFSTFVYAVCVHVVYVCVVYVCVVCVSPYLCIHGQMRPRTEV